MCVNDACSLGRPSSLRGMGRLFISLATGPETQNNFLKIHKTRMIQAAWLTCKAGNLRERFCLSAGDITIRLQGGRKFLKLEKPQPYTLKKFFKIFVFTRAEVMSGLCDCGGEHLLILDRKLCLGQGREGACKGRLQRSSSTAPSDSALCHCDLSWGFTEVTGSGF